MLMNKRIHFVKIILIIVACGLILAIPMVKLTLNWSMDTAYSLYGKFTRIVHLHSPSITGLDENGVPMEDYGYQKGEYIGVQRNPLTIATQALSYYREFREEEKVNEKEHFLNCIHWLEEFRIEKGDYLLWAYEFEVPSYNASAPWYSAMAQARIMVAFERAYELTQDEHYLQLADGAMRALEVPIELGGVLYIDPKDNGKWYEELAGGGRASPPLILNGFIFSLLDLHDFYVQTGSQDAKSLFEEGITELKRHLSDYDTGRWTYYDRVGHLAYDYHYVHINQMQELYEITGDTEFKAYHDKWASYFPINPMWARERFAAYLFDAAVIVIVLAVMISAYKIYRERARKRMLPKG
jgi:heparosan-N-sulfate-glucuronate 5-epimerase